VAPAAPARTPEVARQLEAIEQLSTTGGAQAVGRLQESLRSENREVVETAIQALEDVGGAESARALGEVLTGSRDVEMKVRAVEALEVIGGQASAEELERALTDPEGEVRERAVDALLLIGDRRAVQPLWQAYRAERDDSVRDSILMALEALGENVDEYWDQ
jgi:HEAT repeat protein